MKTTKSFFEILAISSVLLLGLSAGAQLTTPFSSSLVLDLPLDGSAVDVGPNNFTINGGGTWVPNRFLQANSALSLNGVDQDISIPCDTRLFPTEMTLSGWFKFQQLEGEVWRAGNASADGWRGFDFGLTTSGLYYNDYTGSSYNAQIFAAATNFAVGTWYSLVITRSSNSCAMFVNGVKLALQTDLTPYASPAVAPMRLGSNYGFSDELFAFCPMTLGTIHIYNRALADGEVAQLYAVESTKFSRPYLNFTIALNISTQSSSNVMGAVSTTAAPTLSTLATKDILNALAFDEHAAGKWPGTGFPKNTTLALAGNSFVVLNGTHILLNVSDIMSFNTGEPKVISGKQNTVTGLASPTAQKLQIADVIFDDTFINGGKNLKFYLNGVLKQTTTDTAPANGVYTETQTLKITTAAGDGSAQNVPFICTGSVSATGKSPLHL